MQKSYVFYGLREIELDEIIQNMFFGFILDGEYLFKQNDPASSFFLINSGKLQVEINGKAIKILERGACLGEIALLYNSPRSGSIKALEKSHVWGIAGPLFKKVLREINI